MTAEQGSARPSERAATVSIPGPVAGTRMTPEYVTLIGRMAYLWAWPMVNMHNRRTLLEQLPGPGLNGGVAPVAPPNQLCMLHDYIAPAQRFVACPNQDVTYGFGIFALDVEPVVVQVPDFGGRFWVYQVGDQRTDGFGQLGAMYGTAPGRYLVVGPEWDGTTPKGIAGVLQSPTNLAYICPRVFMDDTAADRQVVLPLVNQIMAYPLSQSTGQLQTTDWTAIPSFPSSDDGSGGEMQWVDPDAFFASLSAVLDEVPPLPGEEALYTWVRSVLDAAAQDAELMAALNQAALDADKELIAPLFAFSNEGIQVANGWNTIVNGAAFGTDYLTRTAVAKSNIFVNRHQETAYFYEEQDGAGDRLHGDTAYTVTFPKDGLPPAKGFWSLTLYDQHHFFAPNELNRYSLGAKNRDLVYGDDGSLTISIQAGPPPEDRRANWLPAPREAFELYVRAYWPEESILQGSWWPPLVVASTP